MARQCSLALTVNSVVYPVLEGSVMSLRPLLKYKYTPAPLVQSQFLLPLIYLLMSATALSTAPGSISSMYLLCVIPLSMHVNNYLTQLCYQRMSNPLPTTTFRQDM